MLERWKKRFFRLRFVRLFRIFCKRIHPIGFEGMSVYEIGTFLWSAFRRTDFAIRGAAIAFNFFLAIFPMIILLLSLIPYVPIENFQHNTLMEIESWLPNSIRETFHSTIDDLVHQKHTVVLSIGFVLTTVYASSSINAILSSFSSSYQVALQRNPIKQRVISFGLMFGLTILVIMAIAIIMFGNYGIRELQEMGYLNGDWGFVFGKAIKWTIVSMLLFTTITFLYNFGNPNYKRFKYITAGSTLSTFVIVLATMAFTYYTSNFGNYNELYGSLGSLIIFLMWIYLSARILLIGFELTTRTHLLEVARKTGADKA